MKRILSRVKHWILYTPFLVTLAFIAFIALGIYATIQNDRAFNEALNNLYVGY